MKKKIEEKRNRMENLISMVSRHVYFFAPCLLRKFSRVGFMVAIIKGQRSTKLRSPSISSVSRGLRGRARYLRKPEFLLGIGLSQSIFQFSLVCTKCDEISRIYIYIHECVNYIFFKSLTFYNDMRETQKSGN